MSAKGGGIYSVGIVTLMNTIVAKQLFDGDDIYGSLIFTSAGNLIGNGTGMIGIAHGSQGNQVGTAASPIDPKLGPLANNGGPTNTIRFDLLAVLRSVRGEPTFCRLG